MFQVFECIQALLKSDPDVIVKRSAAVCATLLLRGLSKDCLKVVAGCFSTIVVTDFLIGAARYDCMRFAAL